MGPKLQRACTSCGAAAILLTGLSSPLQASSSPQGYRFRGIPAPQVRPSSLAGELTQRIQLLQQQLKSRSIDTSLTEAIEQSLLNNPDLTQAYTQIQQSQWNLIAVRRQWYPTLTATSVGPAGGLWGVAGSRTDSSRRGGSGSIKQESYETRNVVAPSINIGWTFFDPSRSPEINAASEDLRSQELLFNVSARNLVLQTQLAYFNLQEQQQLVRAYEQILAATTDQVNQAESLFNAGTASLADVEQIRTQQYQTLSLLITTYLGMIDAASSLARAMALQPNQLALPKDTLDSYGQWDMSLEATIEQAQALREEIQSSLAQANSATWRATSLFNRYWPRFALAASGAYLGLDQRSGIVGGSGYESLKSENWNGAVGIGFNWSIFDGGIAAAQGEADKARARQLDAQAESQRLQVSEEVERSFSSYEASRLALISSREQLESARKAAEAVRERFNVGYADTTSVVQTLNQAIIAANAYARSQRDYNTAMASLYRATAQWPGNTQALRDLRVESLKQQ